MNDETFTYENREYVSPTVSRDEQTNFIDTLRQTNTDNINRINAETKALGSQVEPTKGGFSSGAAFAERYNTPQVNDIVAGLKATAQQTALNQALTNLQNQWSQRYNEAYRNAKIKEYNESQTTTPANPTTGDTGLDIETNNTDNDTVEVSTYTPTYGDLVPTSDTTYEVEGPDPLGKASTTYTLREPTELEASVVAGHPLEFNSRAQDGNTYVLNGVTYRYTNARGWLVQTGVNSVSK